MDMKYRVCPMPWQHMEVGHEHNVYLCCHLPTPVGNLAKDGVMEVWSSPTAQQVRASILDGSYAFCRHATCPILDQPEGRSPRHWTEDILAIGSLILGSQTLHPTYDPLQALRGPLRISLSNERSCNLRCPSCRSDRYLQDPDEATLRVWEKIASDSTLLRNAEVIRVSGSGEFTQSPRLLDLVRRILRDHPHLGLELISNLTTFGAEQIDEFGFQDRIRSIQGSIDAFTPETYERVRGGCFSTVMRNLESLAAIKDDDGFDLTMGFVVQEPNFREISSFAALAISLGARASFWRVQSWGHLPSSEFESLDVADPGHPRHAELVDMLRDPLLLSRHVWLNDLLRLAPG